MLYVEKRDGKEAVENKQKVDEELERLEKDMKENLVKEKSAEADYLRLREEFNDINRRFQEQQPFSSGIVAKLLQAQNDGRLQGIHVPNI